jgi:hypothetical protein
MPNMQGKKREEESKGEETISRPEDSIIREWLKDEYGIQVRQWYFWRLSFDQAYQKLKKDRATLPDEITAEALARATRRE